VETSGTMLAVEIEFRADIAGIISSGS
jgi:hypothetical protein